MRVVKSGALEFGCDKVSTVNTALKTPIFSEFNRKDASIHDFKGYDYLLPSKFKFASNILILLRRYYFLDFQTRKSITAGGI